MFRLSHYLKLLNGNGVKKPRGTFGGNGPIVIWNLTRTCNLECMHCYASSKNHEYSSELDTASCLKVLDDLKKADCFSLILSGGEPLLRDDLFEIAKRAKELGFFLTLSTNGTLIDDKKADMIAEAGFDYVGISLDGMDAVHDEFRGKSGAFEEAVSGLEKCKERGLRVGVRFTLTKVNGKDLPSIFDFVETNGIEKLYLSHLVYSGRGGMKTLEDLAPDETRQAMTYIVDKAFEYAEKNRPIDLVTGNNEADAVFLMLRLLRDKPAYAGKLMPILNKWGGNSAGRGVCNIDTRGNVHPDPLLYDINLGNVLETAFDKIWFENDNKDLLRLREVPRKIKGRCGRCAWLKMCNGASRVRAQRKTDDLWKSDPACYITDFDIGMGEADAIGSGAGRRTLILNR